MIKTLLFPSFQTHVLLIHSLLLKPSLVVNLRVVAAERVSVIDNLGLELDAVAVAAGLVDAGAGEDGPGPVGAAGAADEVRVAELEVALAIDGEARGLGEVGDGLAGAGVADLALA